MPTIYTSMLKHAPTHLVIFFDIERGMPKNKHHWKDGNWIVVTIPKWVPRRALDDLSVSHIQNTLGITVPNFSPKIKRLPQARNPFFCLTQKRFQTTKRIIPFEAFQSYVSKTQQDLSS